MVSLLCLLRQGSGQSHVREGPETHLGVAANQEDAPDVLLLMAWGLACLLVRAASTAASSSSDTATRPHGHTPLSLPSSLLTGLPSLLPLPGPSICLAAPAVLASSLSHTLRRDHPDFLLPFPFPLLLPLVYIFLPPPSSFLPSPVPLHPTLTEIPLIPIDLPIRGSSSRRQISATSLSSSLHPLIPPYCSPDSLHLCLLVAVTTSLVPFPLHSSRSSTWPIASPRLPLYALELPFPLIRNPLPKLTALARRVDLTVPLNSTFKATLICADRTQCLSTAPTPRRQFLPCSPRVFIR